MMDASSDGGTHEELDARTVFGWAEFCCWVALGSMPILRLIDGRSVSRDQSIVRTVLALVTAAVAALLISLRLLVGRRSKVRNGQ